MPRGMPTDNFTTRQIREIGDALIPVFTVAMAPKFEAIHAELASLKVTTVQLHTRRRQWNGILAVLVSTVIAVAAKKVTSPDVRSGLQTVAPLIREAATDAK